MITKDQYAASIIEKYRVVPDTKSTSHRAADEVLPLLKQWGKQHLLGLTLSGAYVKNTAITLSSHVDVLIALSPVPGMEMKNIYWSLFDYLTDHDLRPYTRDVSIRLLSKGFSVDLIPAYRDRETGSTALFNKRSGKVVHTDVARHVHLIASACPCTSLRFTSNSSCCAPWDLSTSANWRKTFSPCCAIFPTAWSRPS